MLTKYLAEVGEKTPLTAATCINNPFDLEEATRATPCHIAVDQKLTRGLVDILQSNKVETLPLHKAVTVGLTSFHLTHVSWPFDHVQLVVRGSALNVVALCLRVP